MPLLPPTSGLSPFLSAHLRNPPFPLPAHQVGPFVGSCVQTLGEFARPQTSGHRGAPGPYASRLGTLAGSLTH